MTTTPARPNNPIGPFKDDELRRIVTDVPSFEKVFDAFPILVVVKSACKGSFGKILIWNPFAAELTWVFREDAARHQKNKYLPAEPRQFFAQKDREPMGRRDPVGEPTQSSKGETRVQC